MSAGWNTIESDAGVFTYLMENLGVKGVQFEELLTLEADTLRNLSPVYGVIFLFKYPTNESSTAQAQDGSLDHEAAENLFFARQTIQNACGTQALLSVLLNKDTQVNIGPGLADFKDFTSAFPSDLRGEALSNSELIRTVHNSFARAAPFIDETQRAATDDDDVYHFIAYTSLNGMLYELDGLQPAPIGHGKCSEEEFPEKVIPVLQRRIARYPAHEIRFNLLAMVRDLRERAKEFGDQETLEVEERKRRDWMAENALRRHNFVGFVGEILATVTKEKLRKGNYDDWLGKATQRTTRRLEERQRRTGKEE